MAQSKVFSLEGKGLKLNTAEDIQPFLDEITAETTEIRLSGNTFGVEAISALADALSITKSLKTAELSDIFTGRLLGEIPLALKSLCDAFLKQPLEKLNLSDNAFGPAGANPLVEYLENAVHLKVLMLNNNGLGPQGGSTIAKALVSLAEKLNSEQIDSGLEVIVIGRNRLENAAAKELGKAIKAHSKTLQQILLPQNGIRPEGVEDLSEALATCKNLEILDLNDNTFTQVGSLAFSKAIDKNEWPKLKNLNIGDCLLGSVGSKAVWKSLSSANFKELNSINYQYNEMDEDGALIAAQALLRFESLNSLSLNGNSFNPDGSAAEAIKNNLDRMGKLDILDEWDDMDYEEDSEEESEEESGESECEETVLKEGTSMDALASAVNNLSV
ncbi:RNI-like protein [Rozella allomycis CSF55]|uniref:RNI-like protein n=1 Tax=Rozella allomycis (strain CSF55) TaxID=988480 RepID=A0A075B3D5_ROZAC|nr:Ran GTPase-activating protein domain-containing protein [Rozella allomycis CSF55]RKP19738.1 RNI-like protein [Rozella allomycis CSF55]|eukprot:EPZ36869.1 Ran GTPase-activating protein domain-containing protein [Rozella allomycis CSF55]